MNASLSNPFSVFFSCGKQMPVTGSGVQEDSESDGESVLFVETEDPVLLVQLRRTKKRKNRTTIPVTVPIVMFLMLTGMINCHIILLVSTIPSLTLQIITLE